ncbi:MAG: hypothetical protein OXH05_11310 [Acidobacteria bacterium]|nr:hypothetical protein [Acidobacteriota bacterium]
MSHADALRSILQARALEQADAGKVVLKERREQHGTPQTFTLLIGESELTAVRMDKFSHSSMLDGGWKVCDYALFRERKDRAASDVILIELKKSKSNDSSSSEQLRQSVPILEYLDGLARAVASPDDDPAESSPRDVHYVVLYERHAPLLDKQVTHAASITATGHMSYRGMNIHWRIGRHARLSDLIV